MRVRNDFSRIGVFINNLECPLDSEKDLSFDKDKIIYKKKRKVEDNE